jgi:hypothetical protein
VLPKVARVFDPNDVHFVVWVVVSEVGHDLQLHLGLMPELFFVADDLDCHQFTGFVVSALECLAE